MKNDDTSDRNIMKDDDNSLINQYLKLRGNRNAYRYIYSLAKVDE